MLRTLDPGEPLLFKLHYPDNAIVGGGFFAHASLIEAGVAWDAFGEKNGAPSYPEMRRRVVTMSHLLLVAPIQANAGAEEVLDLPAVVGQDGALCRGLSKDTSRSERA
jgi:hypothetical protein